jgi:choline dehydrogenase-like flavoprotein
VYLAKKLASEILPCRNFTTVPQPGYNGRTVPYPRGHVLGGSTAISALDVVGRVTDSNLFADNMAFCRGSRDDYDRWANVTGDAGWSWDSLYPYMLNVCSYPHHVF